MAVFKGLATEKAAREALLKKQQTDFQVIYDLYSYVHRLRLNRVELILSLARRDGLISEAEEITFNRLFQDGKLFPKE